MGGEAVASLELISDYPPLLRHDALVASVPNLGMGLGKRVATDSVFVRDAPWLPALAWRWMSSSWLVC